MDLSGALSLSLEYERVKSRSSTGLSALPLSLFMENHFPEESREESREETHWSQWSWAIGQYLTRDIHSESKSDPWLNRDDLTEILLQNMTMIQIQKLPLDASFLPLGTDPLLHAPAWWNSRGSGDSASTVSLWACDRSADLRSGQGQPIRAGVGLTLDLSSGSEWDCRITGNVDQSGEAGILLQFCWH